MDRHDNTWVIIPVFNEQPMIGEVVADLRTQFPNVLCIDDGSRDESVEQACKAGAKVLCHPINLGQGASLQTGISYVRDHTDAKYLVTFDADGQHRVEDAGAMIDRAEKHNLAIVFGSRFLGGEKPTGWAKTLILKTAAWVTTKKTGLHLTDAHNGLRVIRRDAFKSIYLSQNRMAHASQIVSQLARTKLPWEEFPVQIKYTDYSKAKGQSLLNSVNILTELILN